MIAREKVMDMFKSAERHNRVQKYAKFGTVQARPALLNEVIVTTVNGVVETTNTAGPNSMVVMNPGGEQYIIGKEKFNSRYRQCEDWNPAKEWTTYSAMGRCWAFEYLGEAFEFEAPWGEAMKVETGDMIAVSDIGNINDIYRIEKTAFENTYKLIS